MAVVSHHRKVQKRLVALDIPRPGFVRCGRDQLGLGVAGVSELISSFAQVSSQSLVRYRNNDYSVPVAYGHRRVWVRGYVEQVVIGCGTEIIARHRRSYEGEDTVFDPLHYLALIERKIAALDQAAPLAGWELPMRSRPFAG